MIYDHDYTDMSTRATLCGHAKSHNETRNRRTRSAARTVPNRNAPAFDNTTEHFDCCYKNVHNLSFDTREYVDFLQNLNRKIRIKKKKTADY